MPGYIGSKSSVVGVDSYLRTEADATFLTPTSDGSSLTGLPPAHNPVAVTGTTPSLDVGSYNFFNQGGITADTTISFASVPTNARWEYSYIATVDASTLNDLDSVVYSGQKFSVSAQATAPSALFFKPDGLSMYVLNDNSVVYQYTLATAFDVTTAVYAAKSFSASAQASQPFGLFFKSDGLSMYVQDRTNDAVFQYTLSTAWDVSTASYASKSLSTLTQDNNPWGSAVSSDGTKVYMVGGTGPTVYQYNLTTAWDVSTGSYASKSFVLESTTGDADVSFSSDGLTMLSISNVATQKVYQYTLATAWDVSTASYDSKFFDVSPHETATNGVEVIDGGNSFAVIGSVSGVSTFNTALPYALTMPASVVGGVSSLATASVGASITFDFVTDDAGVTVKLIAEEII
jgi:hypothetical protein|tara:strand:+ start:1330 stop:2538 length:1209 start_codon:yes stop_codon:yes gene_type:complete